MSLHKRLLNDLSFGSIDDRYRAACFLAKTEKDIAKYARIYNLKYNKLYKMFKEKK